MPPKVSKSIFFYPYLIFRDDHVIAILICVIVIWEFFHKLIFYDIFASYLTSNLVHSG